MQEDVNFLFTNRIPRRLATRFMGWFSRIEQPLVRDLSIGIWRLFSELDLSDAKEVRFRSLHHCFVRELKDGARPIDADPDILVSPCDAIIGASGQVEDGLLLQIKGFPYALRDLLADDEHAARYRNGRYVTLRLTSGMYHRFHAPYDSRVSSIRHVPGDTWNVNPIALRRVERLFCRNERAVVATELARDGHLVTLVPVAAILVAGIRFSFMESGFDPRAQKSRRVACDVALSKGDEMGWFQHGSTIVLFAPAGFSLCDRIEEGGRIRAGEALMRLP